MTLTELYDSLQDPLTDENLATIVKNYSESKDSYKFYDKLNNIEDEKISLGAETNSFYPHRFNMWKNRLTTEYNIDRLREINESLADLGEFMQDVPDIETKKQYDEIRQQLLKKFGENFINLYDIFLGFADDGYFTDKNRDLTQPPKPEFTQITSYQAKPNFDEEQSEVSDRLYMNVAPDKRLDFAEMYMTKCDDYSLPYIFKFAARDKRDDNMVIYSTTENLSKNIQVLTEILDEHPEIKSAIGNPPIISSKINNWIGYGAEPDEYIKDSCSFSKSYSQLRAKILEMGIYSSTIDWIEKNKSKTITEDINDQKRNITIGKAFANKFQEVLCRDHELNSDFFDYSISLYAPDEETKEYFNSNKFKKKLSKSVSSNASYLLHKFRDSDICNFNLGFRFHIDDIEGKFYNGDCIDVIRPFVSNALEMDENFLQNVKNKTLLYGNDIGIDCEKFACNSSTYNLFTEVDKENSESLAKAKTKAKRLYK
jgi:hypothetical protein